MKMSFRSTAVTPLAAVVAATLLGACGEVTAPATAVRPVYVSLVQPAGADDLRTFTGSVRARVETELAFRVGGKVIQRFVDAGTVVRAGQPLARLDGTDHALAVKAADDQVRAARVDAEQSAADEARFRRLAAEGSVGSADHERQKARADAAAARLDQALRQLELARNREGYATLLAPYDGVVTARRLELGQVVAEGQPVLALARDGEREVVVDIPEEWIGRVRSAAATATGWRAEAQSALALRLRELSPIASTPGRTFRASFAATAESREALARWPLGSTAQLQLVARDGGDRGVLIPVSALVKGSGPADTAQLQLVARDGGDRGVLIPVSALVKGSGPAGVWTLDATGDGLVFAPVQVQAMTESALRVTGLAAGQRVVSVGAQKLDAALRVRAVDRPGADPAAHVARTGS